MSLEPVLFSHVAHRLHIPAHRFLAKLPPCILPAATSARREPTCRPAAGACSCPVRRSSGTARPVGSFIQCEPGQPSATYRASIGNSSTLVLMPPLFASPVPVAPPGTDRSPRGTPTHLPPATRLPPDQRYGAGRWDWATFRKYEGATEMVGKLHRANPSVPVLVMTAIEDPRAHEGFLKAGASEVLSKGPKGAPSRRCSRP